MIIKAVGQFERAILQYRASANNSTHPFIKAWYEREVTRFKQEREDMETLFNHYWFEIIGIGLRNRTESLASNESMYVIKRYCELAGNHSITDMPAAELTARLLRTNPLTVPIMQKLVKRETHLTQELTQERLVNQQQSEQIQQLMLQLQQKEQEIARLKAGAESSNESHSNSSPRLTFFS
jgi:hypothetical protein